MKYKLTSLKITRNERRTNVALGTNVEGQIKSAFLLNGNTGRSSRAKNGTVLPSGNFPGKKEELRTYSSFLVFTELTGISITEAFASSCLCSLVRYTVYFPKLPVERTVPFHSLTEQQFFPYKWKALENCAGPFGVKFAAVFLYKWKALQVPSTFLPTFPTLFPSHLSRSSVFFCLLRRIPRSPYFACCARLERKGLSRWLGLTELNILCSTTWTTVQNVQ